MKIKIFIKNLYVKIKIFIKKSLKIVIYTKYTIHTRFIIDTRNIYETPLNTRNIIHEAKYFKHDNTNTRKLQSFTTLF